MVEIVSLEKNNQKVMNSSDRGFNGDESEDSDAEVNNPDWMSASEGSDMKFVKYFTQA